MDQEAKKNKGQKMFIRDDEKDLHNAAIDKLLEAVVNSGIDHKLSALKGKPVAASMTVEKITPDMKDEITDALDPDHDGDIDALDPDDQDDDDDNGHSMEALAALGRHHLKYCKGGEI